MNRQNLIDAYASAFKLGYASTKTYIGGVHFDLTKKAWEISKKASPQGRYQLHILETLLLGHDNPTGDWMEDVASALEVSPNFVKGMLAGMLTEMGWNTTKLAEEWNKSTEEFNNGFTAGNGFLITASDKPS